MRRFTVAFVAVTLIATAFVAAVTVVENNKFSSIDRIKLPANTLAPGEAGAPANYLIVGSDTRNGLDNPGQEQAFGPDDHAGLSDVMMVVHLVPSQGSAFVVSFPRDTEVDIPGYGTDKLNAAYAYGGPALLIKTFKERFGIKIQHYLAVDFQGFEKIADAVGRVKIYFPTAARDFYSHLYQGRGCQALDGDQALAYARSRHYAIPADGVTQPDPNNAADWVEDPRADLDRIKRQQYFLRSLGETALDHGAGNLLVANRLADAVVGSLTADEDLGNKDIKRLVRTFRGLDPATVEMTTLPVAQESPPAGPLLPQYPDAKPVLDRLKDLSPPVRLPQLADPEDVRVVVVDGSGTDGRASELSDKLTGRGFVDGGEGDASETDFPKTQVRYAPDHAVEGLTVALYLGTSNVVEASSATLQFGSQELTGDVIVVVGKDYPELRGLLARPSSSSTSTGVAGGGPTSTSSTSSTTTTTVEVPDTRYVPVATQGLAPLVGCP
jgi:polyisoprenyl-teichoic acid--peptidoglycan teichoic acid transferase